MTINEMAAELNALVDAGLGDREITVIVEDLRKEIIHDTTLIRVEDVEYLMANPEFPPAAILVDF